MPEKKYFTPFRNLPYTSITRINIFKPFFKPGKWFFSLNENPQYFFYKSLKVTKSGVATLAPLITGFSVEFDESGVKYIKPSSDAAQHYIGSNTFEVAIYYDNNNTWQLPNGDIITIWDEKTFPLGVPKDPEERVRIQQFWYNYARRL